MSFLDNFVAPYQNAMCQHRLEGLKKALLVLSAVGSIFLDFDTLHTHIYIFNCTRYASQITATLSVEITHTKYEAQSYFL